MRYLILLLFICSSLDSHAQRKDRDLDELMEIQLADNCKRWRYSTGGLDVFYKIDSIKQVFDSLGYYYMTDDHFPRCITKFSDIKFRLLPFVMWEPELDTLEWSAYQLHLGEVIDWVWLGDIDPIHVDVFKCNDRRIKKYVQEKLIDNYDKMTILHKSYNIPMLRIDTINGETVVKCAMFAGYSEHHIYQVAQKKKEYLKGVTVINGTTVFLFGNAIEDYFRAKHRNIAMSSPLPPHKSNYGKYSQLAYSPNYNRVKYTIYTDGELRETEIKIDNPFNIYVRHIWNRYDTFIIDDVFLGIIEEAQRSKGLKTISPEEKFDINVHRATAKHGNDNTSPISWQ